MKPYEIRLSGCDDSTAFEMDLTDEEAAIIGRIAVRSREVSEFDCQPRMTLTVVSRQPAPLPRRTPA